MKERSLGMGIVDYMNVVKTIIFKDGKWVRHIDIIKFLPKVSDTE